MMARKLANKIKMERMGLPMFFWAPINAEITVVSDCPSPMFTKMRFVQMTLPNAMTVMYSAPWLETILTMKNQAKEMMHEDTPLKNPMRNTFDIKGVFGKKRCVPNCDRYFFWRNRKNKVMQCKTSAMSGPKAAPINPNDGIPNAPKIKM